MSPPCPTFGFTLTLTFAEGASEADYEAMIDDLFAMLEQHGLTAAGHGDQATLEFVVRRDGSQATDADRAIVREWADRGTDRVAASVGDVVELTPSD